MAAAPTSRRTFLKQIAASSGAGALAVASPAVAAPAAEPVVGYQSLSPEEGAFTETLVNVMCPADGLTPNGVDCGLASFSKSLGPSVKGVYGRKAGSLAGFAYSRAMRNSSVLWDEKALDAFIAEPQRAIPGNTMPFGGLSDPKQRAEIVDYLKTLK